MKTERVQGEGLLKGKEAQLLEVLATQRPTGGQGGLEARGAGGQGGWRPEGKPSY